MEAAYIALYGALAIEEFTESDAQTATGKHIAAAKAEIDDAVAVSEQSAEVVGKWRSRAESLSLEELAAYIVKQLDKLSA